MQPFFIFRIFVLNLISNHMKIFFKPKVFSRVKGGYAISGPFLVSDLFRFFSYECFGSQPWVISKVFWV